MKSMCRLLGGFVLPPSLYRLGKTLFSNFPIQEGWYDLGTSIRGRRRGVKSRWQRLRWFSSYCVWRSEVEPLLGPCWPPARDISHRRGCFDVSQACFRDRYEHFLDVRAGPRVGHALHTTPGGSKEA